MALFNGQTISPGTLHIAQLAREAKEAEKQGKVQPEDRRTRWMRIGVEVAIAAIVLLVVYLVVNTRQNAIAQNVPIGRARFSFANTDNDRITFALNRAERPGENEHLQAWLLYEGEDGETFRDIGTLAFDASGIARLEYTDLAGSNLMEGLREIQITKEQNASPAAEGPSGEVVYSSSFPPQALAHVRNLVVSFDGGSDQASLIAGLYYYSGSYVEAAVNGDTEFNYVGMAEALENGDEATFRKRNEELINMIVGSQSDLYKDYDGDGIEDTQANEYGSLPNGDQAGYLEQTALEAQAAAEAPDTTENIREQNETLQICIQNMKEWTDQILPLALELQEMPFGPAMKPLVDELSELGLALSNGVDTNENNIVEPPAEQCGAFQAYDYGIHMADFPIFIGPDRIPPTVAPPTAEN
jgi:hypothetical protein